MSKEIFELLAQYGLKKPTDLKKVFHLTSKAARNLHEQLWEALFRFQYENIPQNRDAPGAPGLVFETWVHSRSARIRFA